MTPDQSIGAAKECHPRGSCAIYTPNETELSDRWRTEPAGSGARWTGSPDGWASGACESKRAVLRGSVL